MPYNIRVMDNTKGVIVDYEETGFRNIRSAETRRKELIDQKESSLGYSLYEAYYKKSNGYNDEKKESKNSIIEYYYAKTGNTRTVYVLILYNTDYPNKSKLK